MLFLSLFCGIHLVKPDVFSVFMELSDHLVVQLNHIYVFCYVLSVITSG